MAKINPESARRLALVAPAAFEEAKSALAVANAVRLALAGSKLTGPDGKPSARFNAVRLAYCEGYMAARIPNTDNMPDVDRLDAARKALADPKRGDDMNKLYASARVGFKRALDRAGIASPAANAGENNGNKSGSKPPADKTAKGQGKSEAPAPSALEKAVEKFMPPQGAKTKDREAVITYARVQLQNILIAFERCNGAAKKAGTNAVPPQLMGDVMDWVEIAKKWTF